MNPNSLAYWYWLRDIKKIGPARVRALTDYFGSPESAYQGDYEEYLQVPSVGPGLARNIVDSKLALVDAKRLLEQEQQFAEKIGATILALSDSDYPQLLKDQVAVAPAILYLRGSLRPLTSNTVAIVGTRRASGEGLQRAFDFGRRCADTGWQVISGLAAGIDAAGHRGALAGDGYTVAVLGCGVDRIYPNENKRLFAEIVDKGAVISEYPFRTAPKGDNLRKRNKITVALSRAVVVAECPLDSGTLIAAQEAQDQVKPVFAFSFRNPPKSALGSQQLLEQGKAKELGPSNIDQLLFEIDTYHATDVVLLFDLDKVLADTSRLSAKAVAYAVKKVEGASPNKNKVQQVANLSPRAALKAISTSNIDALLPAFHEYWNKHYISELIGHPQLKAMLAKLRTLGLSLGIVTSRNLAQTNSTLEALGLKDMFGATVTWGHTTRHKPDPEPIRLAVKQLNPESLALYVGDRADDIAAARAAGVLAVGATWFLDERDKQALEEAQPDHIVTQPSDLYNLVLLLKSKIWSNTPRITSTQ